MAQEEVTILRVKVNEDGTRDAVKNINELKENIKLLKERLGETTVGTLKYAQTLKELQDNQTALKNAMHATTATTNDETKAFEQTARVAKGASDSYNGLVRQMNMLDQAFRSTENESVRLKLGERIKAINEELKKLDEARGKYGRNVGNYKSAFDGLSNSFKATAGSASSIIAPLGNVTRGLKALSATPAIAILGLLANVINKVMEGMKSSAEVTNTWNRALAAFQPIADTFTKGMQAVANVVANVANGIVNLLEKWGWLSAQSAERIAIEEKNQELAKKAREIALENAQLERDASELRAKAAEKDKYTAAQRKKMLEDAMKNEEKIALNNKNLAEERVAVAEREMEASGVRNKEALENLNQLKIAALQAETNYYATTRRIRSQIAAAGSEMARDAAKAAEEAKVIIPTFEQIMKMWDEADRKREAQEKWMADDLKGVMGVIEADTAEATNAIQAMLDAQLQAEWDAAQKEKEIQQQRLATFFGFTNALSDIAGSIADIYEADSEADEQAAQKAKALRTASAIIATLSGAVAAFTSTWSAAELPYTAKMVLAPTNAAAVLAAGYAQVKQINAVKVGNASGGGAAVPAPAFSPAVSQVRNITGASEEERLNRMASNQRVYLVYSDLEIANTGQRVKVRETEF